MAVRLCTKVFRGNLMDDEIYQIAERILYVIKVITQ